MKSVLVVDDQAIFREPIEALVREAGYAARGAGSGREALMMMERQRPDLVLLDILMPQIDGLRVLSAMRTNPGLVRIPVIVLSAADRKDRVQEAARLGISGYLLKSEFSSHDLIRRIEANLGGDRSSAPALEHTDPAASPCTAALSPRAVSVDTAPGSAGTLVPIIKEDEFLRGIAKSAELSAMSPVVSRVLTLTENDRCPTESIASAISQDPAVALRVLKLANSSLYARGDSVDSVQKAVVRIGLDHIRQCVLNSAVIDKFSDFGSQQTLSVQHFWEHSIGCGLIASQLARSVDPRDADTAFTLGLLHDVGRVVFAQYLGERYARVLTAAADHGIPVEQAESRLLHLNHADAMNVLLRSWNVPNELIGPIQMHHSTIGAIRAASPQQLKQTLCLVLANRLCHAMLLGCSGNTMVYPIEELCMALQVESAIVADIVATARRRTEEVKLAMLSKSPAPGWRSYADQAVEQLGTPLRALFVSDRPEIDAYQILCGVLSGQPGPEEPTIAVVHLRRDSDRAALAASVEQAEAQAGVKKLPLLLLSDTATTEIDPAFSCGRRYRVTKAPLSLATFIASIHALCGPPL